MKCFRDEKKECSVANNERGKLCVLCFYEPQIIGVPQTKSIKFEAIHSQIQIIGGSIYPKEETWKPSCPCCKKPLEIKLYWDQDASEFSLSMVEGKKK